jgi:AcrR family transcriptional regulator
MTKQAYHHKDLRNALVDEAIEVLAQSGLPALTLRELGRRLGVTHAAAYAHFPDKSALLEQVAHVGFGRLAARLQAVRDGARDAEDALTAMGRAYVAFARESPNLYRLMFADEALAPGPECEMSEEGKRAFAILVDAVGAVAPGDETALRERAVAVWAMVHGLAMLEIDRRVGGKLDAGADVVGTANGLLLRGLRPS